MAKVQKTGPAPKNKAERDKFYREGKRPNAVKIGGKWVNLPKKKKGK